MSIKIDAKNLIKIYGENTTHALELLNNGFSRSDILSRTGKTVGVTGVNFEIKEGEIFVFIGLSGSGKSTVLRCINGLLKPTRGSVCVDGTHIEKMREKDLLRFRGEKMGMVFQHFAILQNRTILDNVAFGLELNGVSRVERTRKAMGAIETVGLTAWHNRYPNELSGGMLQRVGLARALVMDTDILLMDEPFSALDALIRGDMQQELLRLQENIKKTIIFVTHDLDEALRIGNRIAVMRDGAIEQVGSAEDILLHPVNGYVSKFLHSVNVSKILTAGNIASKTADIILETESPIVAGNKMKIYHTDYLFVLNRERKVRGIVNREDITQLIEQGRQDLTRGLKKADTIEITTSIHDIYPVLRKIKNALAVVDERGVFRGKITLRSFVSSLAERSSG
jgi:glycine betaine/proline transport system ATP-binding protein